MRARLLGLLTCFCALAALLAAPSANPAAATPKFKVVFVAPSHTPRVGERWRYSITARTLAGERVTIATRQLVLEGPRTVDVVGWWAFRGTFKHTYVWPAADRGRALVFRIRAAGPGGVRVLDYAVKVR